MSTAHPEQFPPAGPFAGLESRLPTAAFPQADFFSRMNRAIRRHPVVAGGIVVGAAILAGSVSAMTGPRQGDAAPDNPFAPPGGSDPGCEVSAYDVLPSEDQGSQAANNDTIAFRIENHNPTFENSPGETWAVLSYDVEIDGESVPVAQMQQGSSVSESRGPLGQVRTVELHLAKIDPGTTESFGADRIGIQGDFDEWVLGSMSCGVVAIDPDGTPRLSQAGEQPVPSSTPSAPETSEPGSEPDYEGGPSEEPAPPVEPGTFAFEYDEEGNACGSEYTAGPGGELVIKTRVAGTGELGPGERVMHYVSYWPGDPTQEVVFLHGNTYATPPETAENTYRIPEDASNVTDWFALLPNGLTLQPGESPLVAIQKFYAEQLGHGWDSDVPYDAAERTTPMCGFLR